jgi:hypothetical protein
VNSPVIDRLLVCFRGPAFSAAAAVFASSFFVQACATYPQEQTKELLARLAPPVTAVPSGAALAMAERVAATREGDFALAGMGESMAPYFVPGTAVVVHPTSYFLLRRGMSVVYVNRGGTPVAHMLLEKSPQGWLAIGLNNREPDDDVITPRNLVGVITSAFVADAAYARSEGRVAHVEPGGLFPATLLH